MRYFLEKPIDAKKNGVYLTKIDHPLYNSCTIYKTDVDKGLAIVQRRFNKNLKVFFYNAPDSWIIDEIKKAAGFVDYVFDHAGPNQDGTYPTVTIRQVMYALKLKPLKKEWWETYNL